MEDKLDISVIILTYNEEIHIRRCIESVASFARQIIVIDSFSTDKTVEIARAEGAEVYSHKWPGNQAEQFNWALDNVDIKGKWIFRLDADEYPTPELVQEIRDKLPVIGNNVSGIVLTFSVIWMGRDLGHGKSKIGILRIFRNGLGRYGSMKMDEHLEISEGDIVTFDNHFVDDNLNNLSWWSNKHINYAIREASELLNLEYELEHVKGENKGFMSNEAQIRRNRKLKYARQPLFLRSFAYFIYRYFFKGGFLEGKEGFLRHFLQGWWYRTLVDANIFQIKKRCGNDKEKIRECLKNEYGIIFE